MWADNETTIDLLGFDFLVDALEVVLTEPRLLAPRSHQPTKRAGSGNGSPYS
jgi:hypothetical protein